MLMERIIGAITFRKGVYAEVEQDSNFTGTAWMLVVVVGFLSQLGASASPRVGAWLGGTIVGTILAVIGFAVGALVINLIGRSLFKADVSFEELVRCLGLAYVWNVVGFVGILAAFSGALGCVLAPARIVAWIVGLIAWFVATKEALDLDWGETIVTVVLGWLATVIITGVIGGAVKGALGLGAAAMRGIGG
jgi:hypothetical protein